MDIQSVILDKIMLDGNLLPLQFSINEKLNHNSFAYIFDEVGCGKTIEAGIAIFDAIKKGSKNILIVVPSNLTFNWYNEMLSKFGIDFKIIKGVKDSIDIYVNDFNIDVCHITNFCIISYDSKNKEASNAALDRLSRSSIVWNLIVLDEGHETKNEDTNRYNALKKYRSEKVLFLSATPIKNAQEDLWYESELIKNILGDNYAPYNEDDLNNFDDNFAEKTLPFNLTYPVSRNFKESIMQLPDFKKRSIKNITYSVDVDLQNEITREYRDGKVADKNRGSIFLYEKAIKKINPDAYSCYIKSQYNDDDLNILMSVDSKLVGLLNTIENIRTNNDNKRVLIFCDRQEVLEYLNKVMIAKYKSEIVESMHGSTYEKEERKNRIFLLNTEDEEMSKKEIIILSEKIGAAGINLPKISHVINYEMPYTPADMEQRFGRIDRITNKNDVLTMYKFNDTNNFFDSVYFRRIVIKMQEEVLPLLPSKNIIDSADGIKDEHIKILKDKIAAKKYIENMQSESDLTNEDENKNLQDVYNGYNENIIIKVDKNKTVIFDYSKRKSVEFDILKSTILSNINSSLKNFSVTVNSSLDEIKSAVFDYIDKRENKVTYRQENEKGDKCISLTFDELKKVVNNNEYLDFCKEIIHLQDSIKTDIAMLEEIFCKKVLCKKELSQKGLEDFIDFLINEINIEQVNENMVFASLFGVWNVTAKKEKITFEKFMSIYNERSC